MKLELAKVHRNEYQRYYTYLSWSYLVYMNKTST